ncbi:MAG: ATP-binding protein [Arenicella sp.]
MSKPIRKGYSIRTKLTLVALLLLLIPLMSYIYVRDMKVFLIKGQEGALSLTARAISTVLHDRPELFSKSSDSEQESSSSDIYVVPLESYVRLDGDLSDWGDQTQQAKEIITKTETAATEQNSEIESENTTVIKHLLGYRGSFLYAYFDITDDNVLLRGRSALRLDTADHIRLAIKAPFQAETRYSFTAREPGSMSVFLVDDSWSYPLDGTPNKNIKAEFILTETGYIVEARIPRFMLANNASIQLQVADIDDANTRVINQLISTTAQNQEEGADFAKVLLQTPEIDNILKALNRSDARIWVLDSEKKVRAVVGNLSSEITEEPTTLNATQKKENILDQIKHKYNHFLGKIFNLILEDASEISDYENDTLSRSDQLLENSLQGKLVTDRRKSLDEQTMIVMAANPIWSGTSVIGSVIVEQSSNEVLSKQREALENVISVTLIVLIVVLASILYFASRLTLRIRRLRDSAEIAIDRHGRLKEGSKLAESRAGDEVGDLSRSIGNMLQRLSQYTQYLRGLPDTLAHEVSNPLNVVNSSLENLTNEFQGSKESTYYKRAQKGLKRIQSILKNLTEAANLEQALEAETFVIFDVAKLVQSYKEVYQSSNPDKSFIFEALAKPLIIEGTPDHIAQMLDKLIDNAMDFAVPGSSIILRVRRDEDMAIIEVINEGKNLPSGMAERVFEPMVSLGRTDATKTRLGMGLYIVRLIATYHGGNVQAADLRVKKGVKFIVSLPIAGDFTEPVRIAPRINPVKHKA